MESETLRTQNRKHPICSPDDAHRYLRHLYWFAVQRTARGRPTHLEKPPHSANLLKLIHL